MQVLVIEDSLKERASVEQVLHAGGYEMALAENADQALKSIRTGETRFVIADLDGWDGAVGDLVRRTREAGIPPVYFLLLTSQDEPQSEGDDILHKPFRATELKTRLALGQRILMMSDSLSQARDQLENVAMYDPLTGTLNQSAFNRLAQGELERARRANAPFSIIALEIDNIDLLQNDLGLEARNHALRRVTTSIRERSRPYDCIRRWTGAEFMLALFGVNAAFAEKVAERIIFGIRSMDIDYQEALLHVTMSAGIATATSAYEQVDVQGLVEQARHAKTQAQVIGSYQICFADA